MFARLEVIKLNEGKPALLELPEPARVLEPCLLGQEPELSYHGFAIHPEQNGSTALGDARAEEKPQGVIELSFFLPVIGKPSRRRKCPAAASAEESWNMLAIGGPEVASFSDDVAGIGMARSA